MCVSSSSTERNVFLLVTVSLGSIPELPGESCEEIKANEGGQAISGAYWIKFVIPEKPVLVYCSMEQKGEIYLVHFAFLIYLISFLEA